MYKSSTCEELMTLAHGESIGTLEFGATSKFLAAAGFQYVTLWDVNRGTQVFRNRTETPTVAVGFNERETILTTVLEDKTILVWEIPSGTLKHKIPWNDTYINAVRDPDGDRLTTVRISIEKQVIAAVDQDSLVQLWSLASHRPIGRLGAMKHNRASHAIWDVALNPNPAFQRLAVSYWDGCLTIFDITTCKPVVSATARVVSIAISPNGKTLAGEDGNGAIKIFNFETLQMLCRIPGKSGFIFGLAFTRDNLRIIDVRGTQVNVWESSVLMS